MDFITVTKPQLLAAMLRWEQDARNGACLTHDEADALPAAERAQAGADRLWEDLGAVAQSANRGTPLTGNFPLRIEVDPETDTVTIAGVRYSCEFFRAAGFAPLGTWLRINARDITITVQHIQAGSDLARQFDELSAVERGVASQSGG